MSNRLHLRTEQQELLDTLYERTKLTVDDLPYTEEFEALFQSFLQRSGLTMNRHDVWRALASRRKTGKLVRKER